jgi:hypothetical protein
MRLREIEKFQCQECKKWFSDDFFHKNTVHLHGIPCKRTYRRQPCLGCHHTRQDKDKEQNRFAQKARWAIQTHAKRYGMSAVAFAQKFGWNIDRMAIDLMTASESVCTYCGRSYKDLNDITIDIYNRDDPPYWTNTRICCSTDNKAKGSMSPSRWAQRLDDWRIYLTSTGEKGLGFYIQECLPLFPWKIAFALIYLLSF